MAISQYSELKTAVANWLSRSDLTARVPEFISLAESRIAYGAERPFMSPPVRVLDMQTSADLSMTTGTRTVAQPTGYLETVRMYINTDPVQHVEYVGPSMYWQRWAGSETGKPVMFSVEAGNFIFGPSPDSDYTGKILYYKKYDAFSADGDTNWLLTNAPQLYLYGALMEAAPFIKKPEALQQYHALYLSVADGLNAQKKNSAWGNSPMIRTDSSHATAGRR